MWIDSKEELSLSIIGKTDPGLSLESEKNGETKVQEAMEAEDVRVGQCETAGVDEWTVT